jgi:1,2-diacylglycerol 3-alpha-glucosyltransferase
LYALADLFVTASLSEVHPVTLIEASMCGLPIVARRDAAYAGLVRDDYNGYLVDSDQQIADRAAEILDDEAKRLRLARNGLLLSEEFTAERHVERLETLYQQVLGYSSAAKG